MRICISTLTLPLFLFASIGLFAQSNPDIVWQTNAHSETVGGVAFSADGTRLCSGSPDEYWKVWNVPAGDLVFSRYSLNEVITTVALSSNGTSLATGGGDGQTRMWRVSDGIRLWIGGPDYRHVWAVAFSLNDLYLAICRSDAINLRYAGNGLGIPFTEMNENVFDAKFSPDGQTLASAHESQNASLWDIPGGALVRQFIGHSNEVYSVDFSPDGRLLATASADGTARIWNVTNGVCLLIIDAPGGAAKFSANGKLLYTLGDGTFKIWRVSNGADVGSITNTGAIKFDIAKNGKYFTYGTGGGTVTLARMPLVVDEIARTGNQTVLQWQGGSGLYQLQSRTNLTAGDWQNLGVATTNTLATNVNASTLFFRVQSLPNP